MTFWPLNPYYKRYGKKSLLSESLSEALTSNLSDKKIHAAKTYRNGVKLNYIYPSMV